MMNAVSSQRQPITSNPMILSDSQQEPTVQNTSRTVSSSQHSSHPRLPEVVARHLAHPDRAPIAGHDRAAFAQLQAASHQHGGKLIFDSFCGTGVSTRQLAQRYPDCLVAGIDKSADRLARHIGPASDNYLLLRADCYSIWRLAAAARWQLHRHYLLYPNPWPKPGHLQRRVQGNAALRALLQLGGAVELRSNWQVYVEEFGLALHLAGCRGRVQQISPTTPLTAFEAKYQRSNHSLWQYRALLPPCSLGTDPLQ